MKEIVISVFCAIILISCSQRNSGWAQEEKDVFVKECVKNAKNNIGQSEAERYCNCMLGVAMSKWKSGAEADKQFMKMTYEEILKFAEPCR